jgi:uncharacterized protein (DUF849 family)
VLIKVALNGGRTGAPSTPGEIAEDVARCVAAGATHVHVHARDERGQESLFARDVDRTVQAIRAAAPSIVLGVTTGAWILPNVAQRLAAIAEWNALPDFASVNFDEDGCEEVARLLVQRGIGVEAGVLDDVSTQRFLAAELPVIRVLIEVQEQNAVDAMRACSSIESALGEHPAPRLLHGHGVVTWDMIDEAARRGYDTRIGLEDVPALPDGTPATNVQLFRHALERVRSIRG